MFETIFEADNGKRFVFGKNGCAYFGMDIGSGVDVLLGTSQGSQQVGETVESQTVGGRTINVTGELYGDIPTRKASLRNVCAPFTSGRLVFQKTYYIRVFVKTTPSFSSVKNNGLFTMQFFAPFPFYFSMDEKVFQYGTMVPQFRFSVNYSAPHRFGTRDTVRCMNIPNSGDVRVPFQLILSSDGVCANVTVSNLGTMSYLKLNGTLYAGESMKIYRDDDGVLRAELTTVDGTSDAISWIDEGSTLFELEVGDNLISVTDDNGGANLTAGFVRREAVAALYES